MLSVAAAWRRFCLLTDELPLNPPGYAGLVGALRRSGCLRLTCANAWAGGQRASHVAALVYGEVSGTLS